MWQIWWAGQKNSTFPGLAANVQRSHLVGKQMSCNDGTCVWMCLWPEMTALLGARSPNEVSSMGNVSLVDMYRQLEVCGECFLLTKGIKGVARFPGKKQKAGVLGPQWRSSQGASVWLTGSKYNEESHLSRDHTVHWHYVHWRFNYSLL